MASLLAVYLFLLCAGIVQAQCSGAKTIKSNADAESINQCATYDGDIFIDADASGDIYLNGIRSITGSLIVANATSLKSLNADSMVSIGTNLQLLNLPVFENFGFPWLESVPHLNWTGLPLMEGLSFDTGLTGLESMYISDTGLINLSGFTFATIGSMNVNNNAFLQTVGLANLVNTTSTVSFKANAPNLIVQFESLQLVGGDLTFQNISGFSVPDLQNVTGSFTCYSCAMATFRSTWIQIVGGSFAFVSSDLQNLECPALTTVGGDFRLSNNSQLTDLSGFPLLQFVDGSMTLNGVFDSLDFGTLEVVQGDVDVETTSSNQSICDTFNTFRTGDVIKGSLNCQLSASDSAVTNSSGTVSSGSTTDQNSNLPPDNSSSGLSSAAIAGIVVGIVVLITFIGAAIFFSRRRTRKRRQVPSQKFEIDGERAQSYAQLPDGRPEEKAELYVDPRSVAEMKGTESFATEMGSEDGSASGRKTREVPGVHEAEGDLGQPTAERRNTMDMLSPVSAVSEGTEVSRTRSDKGRRISKNHIAAQVMSASRSGTDTV